MEFSSLLSVEDVHQAVKLLRHEDRNPGNVRHHAEAPLHLKGRGRGLEFCPECTQIERFQFPFDAHKKQAGIVVLMLIGMGNVGAVSIKEVCDGRDQAFAIWTVD